MKRRNLYLTNLPIPEAMKKFRESFDIKINHENILVTNALDRITAEPIFAENNSPLYDSAAMDGLGVVGEKTIGASEISPLTLKQDEYIVVDTGDPIMPPFDAVIPAENVQETATIHQAASPWQHVRPIGEDIVKNEMILPSNHKLRPVDLGVLLSGGICKIEVIKPPKVAIIPTGSELVEAGSEISEGVIIESNSCMLKAMITQDRGQANRLNIVKDDYENIKNALVSALESSDIALVCSGTGAGREDYTPDILAELGEVIVHGVAMKPGKPVILAVVKGKPVIGIPGYPVSAFVAYENFVRPIIASFFGKLQQRSTVKAKLTRPLVSSPKHAEYVRVKVGRVKDTLVATPLSRGAGVAMSLVRADGFCIIPAELEGLEAGSESEIILLRDLTDLESTIISIGSHDLVLDVLADFLPHFSQKVRFSSSHVGSLGGLSALQKNEAHLAPIHHLDEVSGVYNVPILKKLFPGEKMALIKCVGRVQGIITAKNNPLGIKEIQDLTDCRYINRQRGAGTRIFFDYKLKEAGISPSQITGYQREAATHMAVAAAIKSGSGDAGLGVRSAAKALDLGFIPIDTEEYDFAVPAEFLDMEIIKTLVDALKSKEFIQRVNVLGGYDASKCGEVLMFWG